MKYVIATLSLINGLWMLIDGIYVIANGKYIGPEKPGPWAAILSLSGVDVFKLGPLFIGFGLAWLVFGGAFMSDASGAKTFGLVLSVLTLWYLPFGTVISIIVIGTLFFTLER